MIKILFTYILVTSQLKFKTSSSSQRARKVLQSDAKVAKVNYKESHKKCWGKSGGDIFKTKMRLAAEPGRLLHVTSDA